jgi:hypothetical protein
MDSQPSKLMRSASWPAASAIVFAYLSSAS